MNPELNNHNEGSMLSQLSNHEGDSIESDIENASSPQLVDRRKNFANNGGRLSFRYQHSQRWIGAKILQIDEKRKTWNGGSCESVYQLEVEVQNHAHHDDHGHGLSHANDDHHYLKELHVVELPYYGGTVDTAPMY